MTTVAAIPPESPFNLDADAAWRRWRDDKLDGYPETAAALVVPVADPRQLSEAEYQALLQRVRKTNMAIYAAATGDDPDKTIPRGLGRRFGLERLDHNYLADDDGISSITVNPDGDHPRFIPYTQRPIKWHTDGYYNTGTDVIRGMLLHCVHDAAAGGENGLLDHEIVYLLMREANPDYVRAMMAPDVMAIPARMDEEGVARPEVTGPVFSVDPASGALHMRYTARKRNIAWKEDPLTREALAWLETLLESDLPYIFRTRLQSGWGLLCNNVLHDRAGFQDGGEAPRRLLYRARYFDRIANT